jgi:hypothetical protein
MPETTDHLVPITIEITGDQLLELALRSTRGDDAPSIASLIRAAIAWWLEANP